MHWIIVGILIFIGFAIARPVIWLSIAGSIATIRLLWLAIPYAAGLLIGGIIGNLLSSPNHPPGTIGPEAATIIGCLIGLTVTFIVRRKPSEPKE